MTAINQNWRAFVAQSTIEEVVKRKSSTKYILGSLRPGDEYAGIAFTGRKEEYILLVGAKIEAVFLGEATGKEEDYLISKPRRIINPAFLQGVRLPQRSPYFEEFKKEECFATGVVYDASENNPTKFYQNIQVPHSVALEAHRWLYRDTTDLRKLPEGLSLNDKLSIIRGRGRELQRVTVPYAKPRSMRDLSL